MKLFLFRFVFKKNKYIRHLNFGMGDFNLKRIFLLVIIVYVIVISSGLFVPLVVNAAKYAQISREIFESGDWINLHIAGTPYEQKPPLLFWLGAVAYKLFGVSQYSFKIAVILTSFAGIFGTFKLGELFYGKKAGILAAVLWATSLGYLHFHNDIHTDTLLADFVILSIWQLAAFFERGKKLNFILGLVFTGFAMLTKGPVGLAIPAFAIGTHLLVKRQFREMFHFRWLIAVPIIGIIILPALWGLYNQFGTKGIIFYFWTNNAGRITGSYYSHSMGLLFPIHTSAYLLAPWTIFAFTGLVLQIKEKINQKFKPVYKSEYYMLGGIIPFLIILSVSRSQMPHYLLSILPLFMIIAGRWMIEIYEKTGLARLQKYLNAGNYLISVLSLLIILLFGFWLFPERRILVWLPIITGVILIIFSIIKLKRLQKELTILLTSIGIVLFFVNTSMIPQMADYHSSLKAAKWFNKKAGQGQKLSIFLTDSRFWSLFYYSKSPGYYMPEVSDFNKRKLPAGDWIYTDKKGLETLDSMQVEFKLKDTFIHRNMTSQSIRFLNPKTRAQHIDKRYLIQLTNGLSLQPESQPSSRLIRTTCW